MKELGYSDGYKYAHDYEGHFVEQQFLPDDIDPLHQPGAGAHFWQPQPNAAEDRLAERMRALWKDRY